MALAGVTAGYELWSETLIINGTVGTGSFDVEMTVTGYGDDEDAGKDVSSISADVSGYTMTVTIIDAYPSITYHVNFTITSTGTVPVHFTGWNPNLAGMPASADVTITPQGESGAIIDS